ncbi:hypothetical protein ISS09_02200 [Candidatus Woesearchaeota archaeon]|nr:hypothetical protein [Candidatus Woesearchaeota archaeon]
MSLVSAMTKGIIVYSFLQLTLSSLFAKTEPSVLFVNKQKFSEEQQVDFSRYMWNPTWGEIFVDVTNVTDSANTTTKYQSKWKRSGISLSNNQTLDFFIFTDGSPDDGQGSLDEHLMNVGVAYSHELDSTRSFVFDFERYVQKGNVPGDVLFTNYFGANFSAEFLFLGAKPLTSGMKDGKYYAWAALHSDHLYLSYANTFEKQGLFFGVMGLEDFGQHTMVRYNPDNESWDLKSRTAFGDVSNFFSLDVFRNNSSTNSMKYFFPMHFTPTVNGGDFTIHLFGHGDASLSHAGFKVGTALLPVNIAVGKEWDLDSSKTGEVYELYSNFNLLGVNLTLEYQFRSLDNDGFFYMSGSLPLSK